MNTKQKTVILIGIVIILLMVSMPPWWRHLPEGRKINDGYAFIANPPNPMNVINVPRLAIQGATVLLVVIGLVLVLKDD